MHTFQQLVPHNHQMALGWTLLHFLWQGSLAAALYGIVRKPLRRLDVHIRYTVALLFLGMMPLAVFVTFAHETKTQEARVAAPGQIAPSAVSPDSDLSTGGTQSAVSFESLAGSALQVGERALPWLDVLWLSGAIFLILRAIAGWWGLRRIRTTASLAISADVLESFERMRSRICASHRVILLTSTRIISPFAMGVWRKCILLPTTSILGLSTLELEAILAHELAHIRRFDYLCNLFQTGVETVLFFHPAVWWISQDVREFREFCCDLIASEASGSRAVYAKALLTLETQRSAKLRLAMPLTGNGGPLRRRVEALFEKPAVSQKCSVPGIALAFATLLLCLLVFASRRNVTTVSAKTRDSLQVAGRVLKERLIMHEAVSRIQDPPVATPSPVTKNSEPSAASKATALPASQGIGATATIQDTAQGQYYAAQLEQAGLTIETPADRKSVAALQALHVSPDYVQAMSQAGMGRPSAHDLVAVKAMEIEPEYVAGLVRDGIAPTSFRELAGIKAYRVDVAYAALLESLGFPHQSGSQLLALRAHGVTTDYARWFRQHFPTGNLDQLKSTASLKFDDAYLEQAEKEGVQRSDLAGLLVLKQQHKTP